MLKQKYKSYNSIFQKIKSSNNIALISHKNPDIDTIWSSTSFYSAIQNNFLNKKVDLICVDEIPKKYLFLSYTNLFKKKFDPINYDLIIFFDSWGKSQTWFYEKYPNLFDWKTFNTISIDHHITNELYAKQNILNTTYSSTTMIIYEILLLNKLNITKQIATNLLAWIYTDTWWFKHSNTNYITYLISSKLIELKADFELIVDKFFKNNSLSTIKLWWKILNESFIDDQRVLYSYVTKSLLDSYNANYDDISWSIDYLNTTEGIKYSMLLTQKWDYIKASLRTLRDDIDLTYIAKQFNWWWHKKASWFTTKWQAFLSSNFKIIDFEN